MKALTVRQPWAGAIAAGVKTVENRSWGTRYRGPLAIHTAAKWSDRGAADPRIAGWHGSVPTPDLELFPLGFIIATAELEDCHPETGSCCAPWGETLYRTASGKVTATVYHWRLADVRTLAEPVPATGRLGLWTVPEHLVGT